MKLSIFFYVSTLEDNFFFSLFKVLSSAPSIVMDPAGSHEVFGDWMNKSSVREIPWKWKM